MNLFRRKNIILKKKLCAVVMCLLLLGSIGGLFLPTPVYADAVSDAGNWILGVLGSGTDFVFGGLLNLVAKGLKVGANIFMTASGFLLDQSIRFSIDSQNFKLPSIQAGWSVLRDVTNMMFIFVLLYIGIATILQFSGFNTKRVLTTLIIVALLVNFSFFLSGVVIDAGNVLAVSIYNALTNDGTRTISEQFALNLQIKSLFDDKVFASLSHGKAALANFGIALVFFLVFFIFLSAAILFILRTIYLIFILLLSPLAFAAAVLPGTVGQFKKWLHYLLNYSFVAPVYLLGTLVVLKIIPDMFAKTPSQGASLAQAFVDIAPATAPGAGTVPSYFGIFMGFIIVGGLLIGVLMFARSMANEIANLSVKWAGRATGMAFGGAAFVGRRTVGRGFAALSRNEGLKEAAAKSGAAGFAARLALRGAEGGAKSTFDARGLGITKAAAGGLETDFGKAGGKGGFEGIRKEQLNKKMAIARSLGETTFSRKESEDIREFEELISLKKATVERARGTGDTVKEAVATQQLDKLNTELGKLTRRGDERVKTYASKTESERFHPLMSSGTKREAAKRMRGELGKTKEEKLQDQMAGFLGKLAEQGGGGEAGDLAKKIKEKPSESQNH